MIERLIEDWLTRANEREYEVPFCQLLMAEGHRVVHRQSHGPAEQGKDVISVDPSGLAHAFQLKTGNIALSRWRREILPEVSSLTEVPILHPSVAIGPHSSHLVTNGRLTDAVTGEINSLNVGLRARNLSPLETTEGSDLASRFLKAHGRFLPRHPQDFGRLLRLYSGDGGGVLPKPRFAVFLQNILSRKQLKRSQVGSAAASAAILAAYALAPFQKAANHWALAEGWTIVAANIARIAAEFHAASKHWQGSFDLARQAARDSVATLIDEALNAGILAAGDMAMDGGPPYRARTTILLGAAAVKGLIDFLEHGVKRPEIERFIRQHWPHRLIWGESAVPFCLVTALFLEAQGRSADAEGIIEGLTKLVGSANAPSSNHALPDPYYGASACISVLCGVRPPIGLTDNAAGRTYTVGVLIDFLARRLRKQTLRELWKPITALSLVEMDIHEQGAYYRWRTRKATPRSHFVQRPTRWSDLLGEASGVSIDSLPDMVRERPDFALLFMLTYPHRLNRALLMCIERALQREDAV